MSPILGIYASQNYPRIVGAYESIATTTLGSSAATVVFSSIPATYTHLQLRLMTKDATTAATILLQANSDTGTNYVWHRLRGDGSTVAATNSLSQVGAAIGQQASAQFGATIADILDYANTNKYKTSRGLSGYDENGSGAVGLWSGLWMNTSAISTLTVRTGGGTNIAVGSHLALYGIKGA